MQQLKDGAFKIIFGTVSREHFQTAGDAEHVGALFAAKHSTTPPSIYVDCMSIRSYAQATHEDRTAWNKPHAGIWRRIGKGIAGVTWTKAHTQKSQSEDEEAEARRILNDEADKWAKKGAEMHRVTLEQRTNG